MEWKNIDFEVDDRVALITVNRPARRNALDLDTVNELHAALNRVSTSDDIGVAIITGAGDRVFVAGADITQIQTRGRMDALRGINSRLFKAIEDCDRPVIAAVNGFAMGGGFELALACDIRVCSEQAKFGLPEVTLGIIPAAGGMYRLQRVAGMGVAKEMVFTGEPIDAKRAHELRIVSRVVPQDQLLPTAREIARKILSRAPLAIRLAKRTLNAVPDISTEAAVAMECMAQGILFESEDKQEGTAAFLSKRPPNFKGK